MWVGGWGWGKGVGGGKGRVITARADDVPGLAKCISGSDLLTQWYMQPHRQKIQVRFAISSSLGTDNQQRQLLPH